MTGPPELHGRLSVSDTWSMWHVAEMSNWVFVLAASESLSLITDSWSSGNDRLFSTLRPGFETQSGYFSRTLFPGVQGFEPTA